MVKSLIWGIPSKSLINGKNGRKVCKGLCRYARSQPRISDSIQILYQCAKKERHKDNSKGVSVVDTARKVMVNLSPAQQQCLENTLKEKGGNTERAIEKILAKEISTAERKKGKKE